jgi:hypothetical protein
MNAHEPEKLQIMKPCKTIYCLLVGLSTIDLPSLTRSFAQSNHHPFALYMGGGPNFYFNNLETSKNTIQCVNYSLVGRLMWEPERFISLGIESGYYQLYTAKFSPAPASSMHISKLALPILLVASTKLHKNYYVNFSIGQTCIMNQVKSLNLGDSKSSSWSLADFGLTGGYRYVFKNRFTLCAEAKYFYSSKYADSNVTLAVMFGYKF